VTFLSVRWQENTAVNHAPEVSSEYKSHAIMKLFILLLASFPTLQAESKDRRYWAHAAYYELNQAKTILQSE